MTSVLASLARPGIDAADTTSPVRSRSRGASFTAFAPLVILTIAALSTGPWLSPWAFMSVLALAIYFGLKWMTWRDARDEGLRAGALRSTAYLLLWPGMDARAFLGRGDRPARPAARDWLEGAAALAGGGFLLGILTPRVAALHPLLGGWVGFLGLGLLFHFGGFRLLALAWRAAGVRATPIMNAPWRARSLAELWGRRWNLAFHDLATRLVFGPLRGRVGAPIAGLAVFLASGLVHELVISVPARGGYGLPTLYFLVQGFGILAQRAPLARRLGLAEGAAGRLTTLLVAAGPVFFLFHPPFIHRVVLPLLVVLGAVKGA